MTSRAVTSWRRHAIVAGIAVVTLSIAGVVPKPAAAAAVVFHMTAGVSANPVAGTARLVPAWWGGCFRCGGFGRFRRPFADRDDRPFFRRGFVARRRFFFRQPFFFPHPFAFGRFGGVRFGFFR